MKIDVFNHILPKNYFDRVNSLTPSLGDLDKRMKSLPLLVDLDLRMKSMDTIAEDYVQIPTLSAPPIELVVKPELSPEVTRIANDSMAEIVDKYSDKFPGFIASLPLNNPDACPDEIDRAIKDLKAVGVQLFSNVCGKPLDLPEFKPIFEKMAQYDLPLWIHPARNSNFSDYQTEDRSKYEIFWCIGWPYETGTAMIRLVFAGYFDLWPNLKIVTHHMGGVIPSNEGRLGPGYDVMGVRSPNEDFGPLLRSLKKKPLEYFRMFYGDTATFGGRPAAKCGLDFFGSDNVVFATDYPFTPMQGYGSVADTIKLIEEISDSNDTVDKILDGNARRIMKLND